MLLLLGANMDISATRLSENVAIEIETGKSNATCSAMTTLSMRAGPVRGDLRCLNEALDPLSVSALEFDLGRIDGQYPNLAARLPRPKRGDDPVDP